MNISENGKKLIKKYEGCRLKAYKPVSSEKFYTIGWGHYSKDVKAGQKITHKQADALFDKDIVKYVKAVQKLDIKLNQNQFDALVSFAYNCGIGNLYRLCSDRKITSISKYMTAYNKSNGRVLNGLVKRRAEEKALFDKKPAASKKSVKTYVSLVDYLKDHKKDSSFAARSKLATKYKIKNYRGTAAQNSKILALLQK